MTPEAWQRIEDAFHKAVELPASDRPAFLAELAPEVRDEVSSLIESCTQATEVLQKTVEAGAVMVANSVVASMIGERLGPYRVTALIGEGGMGSVYRAVRDDEEYKREVAIKVLRHGFGTASAIARFRDERQILAALDHPGIVRLLDGGSTERGAPYLVLEYVEGVQITRYARDKGLAVRQRLELLLPVCAAVQYAHQRLVVHRDIKPSNVIVGSQGPKLLDFGIAKLLDPGAAADREAQTRTGMALLTPEYASPEQARGEAVSTATDVYSLGALLYELLADKPPHEQTASPLAALREICEVEPPRPSTICPAERRTAIAGDLDTIVAKALAKEPAQRYGTVDQLADDLRRHLQGQPIAARPASLGYRATKFLRRNRGSVAAAGVVTCALVASTVWSMREARRADHEAQRAEHRFAEGRKLATTVVYQVEAKIHSLKGATAAREQIVRSALEYLDGLAADASDEPGLSRELAFAYMKLGDVQGDALDINIGQSREALLSFQKAQAILDRMTKEHDAPATLRARAACRLGTGLVHQGLNDPEARDVLRDGLALADKLPSDQQVDMPLLLRSLNAIGFLEDNQAAMKADIARGTDIAARWLTAEPTSPDSRYWSAIFDENNAELAVNAANPQGAADLHRRAVEIFTALAKEQPDSARNVRDLAVAEVNLAGDLGGTGGAIIWQPNTGDLDGALVAMRNAVPVFEDLAARDSQDIRVRVDVGGVISTAAAMLAERDLAQAMPVFDKALAVFAALPAAWREEYYTRQMEWYLHCAISTPLAKLGKREDAASHARHGLEMATRVGSDERGAPTLEMCSYMVAGTDHILGDDEAAAALLNGAIDRLGAQLAKPNPPIVSMIGSVSCLQMLAVVHPRDACPLARRAADTWRTWQPRTPYLDAHQAELDRAVTSACAK
jgi:tetratricopeptide (TPR) repeat protein